MSSPVVMLARMYELQGKYGDAATAFHACIVYAETRDHDAASIRDHEAKRHHRSLAKRRQGFARVNDKLLMARRGATCYRRSLFCTS